MISAENDPTIFKTVIANDFHIYKAANHLQQADWLATRLIHRESMLQYPPIHRRSRTYSHTHPHTNTFIRRATVSCEHTIVLYCWFECVRYWDTLPLMCQTNVYRCENIIFIFNLLALVFHRQTAAI